MPKQLLFLSFLLFLGGCKPQSKENIRESPRAQQTTITYAKGFSIEKQESGLIILKVLAPWPNAEATFTYALVPKERQATITLDKDSYDAIITVPIERIVVTSTTHIPALEALGVLDKLIGFPDTKYISSKEARKRIKAGLIQELGINENLNTEAVLALRPNLVVGFAVKGGNTVYDVLKRSQIPVVYNGDWVEETPLGKAEWIKFFAPFFEKENEASTIFKDIENSYLEAKKLASRTELHPMILSGALYKDVWYLPGGKSWAANFLKDANANYLWSDTSVTGSLSLSWENVLVVAKNADYWIGPAQFTSYAEMESSSNHYLQFEAFKNRKVYTIANTVGETGGNVYYELAPQRPDLVLKDLIHILHPGLLPNHELYFFKPLH